MEMKYKITYNEGNVLGSVPYILVKEFDLTPNVLKAEIDGSGNGMMVVGVDGDRDIIVKGMKRIADCGYSVQLLDSHINKIQDKCWNCGACVSECPTKSIKVDPDTMEIVLDVSTCIACGSCVDACSVHALKLVL